MAARIRLSSLASCSHALCGLLACLLVLLGSGPLAAQGSGGAKPATAAVAGKPGPKPEGCRSLPGGNAPINRLARIEGGISVRNLELTYFGKPLFKFEEDDYHKLESLWPACGTFNAEAAPKVAHRLKSLIDDAKGVRQDSLDWIKQTEAAAKALKPSQESIEKIHDFWQQMLNREFQMTTTDMAYVSGVLSKRRDELYATPASRQRTLISPFDPGPPEVRTLDRSGG